MRFAAILLLSLAVFSAAQANTCRSLDDYGHYAVENGGVFYYSGMSASPNKIDADPASFKTISLPAHTPALCENPKEEIYAADKEKVFYSGQPIPGAKAESFEIMSDISYAKDGNSVFYLGQPLEHADPATFQLLEETGKDMGHIEYGSDGKPLRMSDGQIQRSFRMGPPTAGTYATDGQHVYKEGRLLPDRDAASFVVLLVPYTKDKNGVYYNDALIPGADPASFIATASDQGHDKDFEYDEAKKARKYEAVQ